MDRHSRRGQPLPPSIRLLSTCARTPSLREAVRPLPLFLGGFFPFLTVGEQCQFLHQYNFRIGSESHLNWGADGGGGVEAQDIGLSYGWGLL